MQLENTCFVLGSNEFGIFRRTVRGGIKPINGYEDEKN